MFSKALLTAAVLSAATAQNLPPIAKREFLENRQFDGVPATCESAINAVETIYSSVPTPPADLLSVTLPNDPCVTPSFTGKLASEWSSYTDAALEWYYEHTSEINAVITACSDVLETIPGALNPTELPTCSTGSTALVGAGSTTAVTATATATTSPVSGAASSSSGAASTGVSSSASAGGASDGTSSSVSPTSTVNVPNAAARETGFAAVAAMAFIGAVAVL